MKHIHAFRFLVLASTLWGCGPGPESTLLISTSASTRYRPIVTVLAKMPVGNQVEFINRETQQKSYLVAVPFSHDQAYFNQYIFGAGLPDGKGRYVSVNNYLNYVSQGREGLVSAGSYEAPWNAKQKISPSQTDKERLQWAVDQLENQGFDFKRYDADHNGVVEASELSVLTISNLTQGGGMVRWECVNTRSGVKYCGAQMYIDSLSNFRTITHETTHVYGTQDLYGQNCFSQEMTLMGCTVNADETKVSLLLDAYHMDALGWNTAKTLSQWEISGKRLLTPGAGRSIIKIVNPTKAGEYYLFEYRSSTDPWDGALPDNGLVVWHVDLTLPLSDKAPVLSWGDRVHTIGRDREKASPDYTTRQQFFWKPADGLMQLQWNDGSFLNWDISAADAPGVDGLDFKYERRVPIVDNQGIYPDSNWQAMFYPHVQNACPYSGVHSGEWCTFRVLPMKQGYYYYVEQNGTLPGLYYTAEGDQCPQGGRKYDNRCLIYAFAGHTSVVSFSQKLVEGVSYRATANNVSYTRINGMCSQGGNGRGDDCIVASYNLSTYANYSVDVKGGATVKYAPVQGLCAFGGTFDGQSCIVAKFAGTTKPRVPTIGVGICNHRPAACDTDI